MDYSRNMFLSPEPMVRLEKAFNSPFRNFIATAKTCYSSKGIIQDEQVGEKFEELAKSLYQAGHHTTLQHACFQFSLANVSRQFIWSFLHSHPFYNSEQVSQRYVAVQPENFAIPPLEGNALELYLTTVRRQMEVYEELTEILSPRVLEAYRKRFPHHKPEDIKVKHTVQKKAQEIARYVLPVATFAFLYHTVSGITLLRYYRLCDQYDAPTEQRMVAEKMIRALLEHDPNYETILENPLLLEEQPEYSLRTRRDKISPSETRRFRDEFDASLKGRVSRLIDYKAAQETVLADSIREVLGITSTTLSDEDALEFVLNPENNRLLGETLNLTTHSKLCRTLFHPSYTFRKKLSHTADSQDQRHRMTPGSRPVLEAHYTGEPDFILPILILQEAAAEKLYRTCMEQTWDALGKMDRMGVPREYALYLLPNAVPIRFTESADLLNLRHKLAMRLCYNAQEEIWRASVDEVEQILEINPRIGRHLLPPCGIRKLAHIKPLCPEGERFCGERVWLYELKDYSRMI